MPEYNIFERMAQVRRSLPTLAPELFHIKTKEHGIIKFTPSAAQNRVLLDPNTGADIILKARQLGISTMSVLEFLAYFLFVDGFNGLIISEDTDKATQLLEIAWLAYDMLDDKYKLPLKHGRDNYLISEAPVYKMVKGVRTRVGGGRGSSLRIGTAGKFTLGRGQTVHACHMSELAFWPSEADQDADTLLQGLEEAVPDKPGAILRIESTANGRGNVFHVKWEQAARHIGRYRGRFFPWWFSLDDEYKKPVKEGFGDLTDDERTLIEFAKVKYDFVLTKEHIQWRRDKIVSKGKKFWQEYPENPDTCFLSTGSSVFENQMEIFDAIRRRLEGREPLFVRERQEVPCNYWKFPRAGHRYVVIADTSEGLKEKSDFSAFIVLDVHPDGTAEECVTGQARTSSGKFSQLLMELATEFNGALIAVERANTGFAVLDTLLANVDNANYDFDIYYHMAFDQAAGKEVKVAGFRPTQDSREVAVQRWGESITAGTYITHDPMVINQAMSFQHNPRTGKMEAPRGTYDDMLNCAFIGNYVKLEAVEREKLGVVEWD